MVVVLKEVQTDNIPAAKRAADTRRWRADKDSLVQGSCKLVVETAFRRIQVASDPAETVAVAEALETADVLEPET